MVVLVCETEDLKSYEERGGAKETKKYIFMSKLLPLGFLLNLFVFVSLFLSVLHLGSLVVHLSFCLKVC